MINDQLSSILEKDVAVVGAGPIGLEMAVALKQAGIEAVLLEADQLGSNIAGWPRETHFFSTPERIAIAGVPIQTTEQIQVTGEQYLAYMRAVAQQFAVQVNTYEPVVKIEVLGNGFKVLTHSMQGPREYSVKKVILATGGMAFPNRLNIPGEELPHVSHYFEDPHRYFQKKLLVVGGMNSALEAVMRTWRAGAEVSLSYRRQELNRERIKKALLDDMDTVLREGKIGYLPGTVPVEIEPGWVNLAPTDADGCPTDGERIRQRADFVLLCTGFSADMTLFSQTGVNLVGEQQIPEFNPDTMESNVRGLYVAGTAAGGSQKRYTHFIETSHIHVKKIMAALRAE